MRRRLLTSPVPERINLARMIESAADQNDRTRSQSPVPTRRAVVAAGLTIPAVVLAACTGSGSDDDGSAKAAMRLATALQSGRFAGSPVTGVDLDSSYAAVVSKLAATSGSVRVSSVAAGTTKSTKMVSLMTSWVLPGGRRWTYPHTVTMTSVDKKWGVQWSPDLVHPDLETGEHLTAVVSAQNRADITDARGEPIVKYRPVYRVGIDKTKAAGATATTSAAQLAKLLDIDAAAYGKSVAAAGSAAFVEAIVLRTEAVPDAEAARIRAIAGAALITDQRPLAPSATFARAVLGSVGPATAEVVTKRAGSKNPVTASDVVGLGGLQQQYDAQLRGTPAVVLSAVLPGADGPAATRPIATLAGTAPTPLRTTLRQDLQGTAEGLLKAQQSPSALVAVKPSTGQIMVAASGAGSKGYDTALLGR